MQEVGQSSTYIYGTLGVLGLIWFFNLIVFRLSALFVLFVLLLFFAPLGYYYNKKQSTPLDLLSFHFMIPHCLIASTVFIMNWLLDFVAKDYGTPFELGGNFTIRVPWYGYILMPFLAMISALIVEGMKFYFLQWSIVSHQIFHPVTILITTTTSGAALGSGIILFAIFVQGFQTVSRIAVFSLLFFSFVPLQIATSLFMGIGFADEYCFGIQHKWYSILMLPVGVSFLSALQKIVIHTIFRGFLDTKGDIIATALLDLLLVLCASIECGFQYKSFKAKQQTLESSGARYNNFQ